MGRASTALTPLTHNTTAKRQANLERHVLKWALANEAGVVFVLVYNRAIFPSLTYVDEFLQRLKEVGAALTPRTTDPSRQHQHQHQRLNNTHKHAHEHSHRISCPPTRGTRFRTPRRVLTTTTRASRAC